MYNKKTLMVITAGLLADVLVIGLGQIWGMPLKDAIAGMMVYAFMGLLVIGYLLRFGLAFLGVIAIYRILRERYYNRVVL